MTTNQQPAAAIIVEYSRRSAKIAGSVKLHISVSSVTNANTIDNIDL